jgi:membrane-bound lytic murein transglycosylase MltF
MFLVSMKHQIAKQGGSVNLFHVESGMKEAILMALMSLAAPYELSFRWCGLSHGVPPWLLKGMAHETSHFNATAHGPTHDWGIMQVIESNAPACGLSVSDLQDPKSNICCAAWLMNRNLTRVRELGARGSDVYLLALMRNNMGGGNVDGKIAALSEKTWASFVAATPQWPGKHTWVETMWQRAQEYRWGEYTVNLTLASAAAFLIYILSR